jgi:putative membrane protein
MNLPETLAAVNAGLNGMAALLTVSAVVAIRRGARVLHGRLMLAAVLTSALFLTSYVIRWSLAGSKHFVGDPWLRGTYLALLFSHMLLAVINVPLVIRAVVLALRQDYVKHKRAVRYTLPIWLYVSLTGVVIYFMLYHLSE